MVMLGFPAAVRYERVRSHARKEALLSQSLRPRKPVRVVCIGGANMDIKCRIAGKTVMGSSNPGATVLAPGGVARNVAHNLARLGVGAALVSAVGRDAFGRQ